jgi:superfamily II DNA/RNA helicase
LSRIPGCQFAFFSATFRGIENSLLKMLPQRGYVKVMIKNDEVMVDEIAQVQVRFRNARDRNNAYDLKKDFLIDLLKNRKQGGKVIIFVQVSGTSFCAHTLDTCLNDGPHGIYLHTRNLLLTLLRCACAPQSKRTCERLVYDCHAQQIPVSEFSGNLDEFERLQRFRQFQAGKTKVPPHIVSY